MHQMSKSVAVAERCVALCVNLIGAFRELEDCLSSDEAEVPEDEGCLRWVSDVRRQRKHADIVAQQIGDGRNLSAQPWLCLSIDWRDHDIAASGEIPSWIALL
ncbi:hypothetical protein BAUCODRAFT_127276 [Baudoinia panamericana UAMH 10762]|uniref:Uncharacterized protein n=1 Tax=Baudoinia panamericana (strain UAMH 10762) TaxID=717646 RepID=M2MYJ4_BAUPA|nr:uncharacterized protein BAUCODRAFT_127276 [Baudoinia panamericana UAMH 10762]EMC91370.1 hypothetical protein BAUCODRAFT_127276 [Baudoinia panamericana UAMH 10762]